MLRTYRFFNGTAFFGAALGFPNTLAFLILEIVLFLIIYKP